MDYHFLLVSKHRKRVRIVIAPRIFFKVSSWLLIWSLLSVLHRDTSSYSVICISRDITSLEIGCVSKFKLIFKEWLIVVLLIFVLCFFGNLPLILY